MTMKLIRSGDLVTEIRTNNREYVYLKTAYGTTIRIPKKKVDNFFRIMRMMKHSVETGASPPHSYRRLIMEHPEMALLIPIWAKRYPDLITEEIWDYSDECSQFIEDAVIAVMSRRPKTIGAGQQRKQKPLNLEDVE